MRAKRGIAAVTALLIVALAAVEVAPVTAGPTASAAKKKKCSKKKRKKGKCGKTADPVALLTARVAGSSFSSTGDIGSNSADGTHTHTYKFCRNGTYTSHEENTGTVRTADGPVPFHEVTDYGGAWKVTAHPRGGLSKTGELKGVLDITITSWQDSEGRPQYATQDSFTLVFPADRPFVIIGDHTPWTRTPGGAGC
jgi:hypothetical protein